MFNLLALFISTGCLTGFIPGLITKKSGAGGGLMGSLIGLGIQLWLLPYSHKGFMTLALIIMTFLWGLLFITRAESYFFEKYGKKRRHTGEEVSNDFNHTNIDEIHGQLVAGLFVFCFPFSAYGLNIVILILAFILFRIFDTKKPKIVKAMENQKKYGKLAIMLDDTMAGGLAAVITLPIIGIIHLFI